MPNIYDNIEKDFNTGLKTHAKNALRLDYCVGYFNIRGWNLVSEEIDKLQGEEIKEGNTQQKRFCRLLLGMYRTPTEIIADNYSGNEEEIPDNKQIEELREQLKEELKKQLTLGSPTTDDENTIKKLIQQLKNGKVVVKLFLNKQQE